MNYEHKSDNLNDVAMDKDNLLNVICHTLTNTDLSTISDKVNSIDLSNQNLCDEDLALIIKAMQQNKQRFDGIISINLSNNFFTNEQIIDELFHLFSEKFGNLQVLILSNCGIKSSLYNDKKLKSLHLSAAITWFSNVSNIDSEADSDDTFDFIDDDDESDEEEQLSKDDENEQKTDFLNIAPSQNNNNVINQQQNDYKSTYLSRAIQSILYYR